MINSIYFIVQDILDLSIRVLHTGLIPEIVIVTSTILHAKKNVSVFSLQEYYYYIHINK